MSKLILDNAVRVCAIGYFFEKLSEQVLGGKRNKNLPGDAYMPEFKVAIEVKSSSNLNAPQVYCLQLDNMLVERAWSEEIKKYWYVLFFYQNGKKCKEEQISAVTPDFWSLNKYLAKKVQIMYVFDIDVAEALRIHMPARSTRRKGVFVSTVPCRSQTMRQFRDFPELTLDKLGLSDFDIVERKFFVNFRRHSVTVPAVFILPTKDQKKLQKFLKEKHTTSKKVLLPEEELVLA